MGRDHNFYEARTTNDDRTFYLASLAFASELGPWVDLARITFSPLAVGTTANIEIVTSPSDKHLIDDDDDDEVLRDVFVLVAAAAKVAEK